MFKGLLKIILGKFFNFLIVREKKKQKNFDLLDYILAFEDF